MSSSYPWLTISLSSSTSSGAKSSKSNNNTHKELPKQFQCLLSVRVTPGSKKDQLTVTPTELSLKITAPPVDGKANEAVIEYFEDVFKNGCASSSSSGKAQDVQLVAGTTSRNKTLQFSWIGGGNAINNSDDVSKCVLDIFRYVEKEQ